MPFKDDDPPHTRPLGWYSRLENNLFVKISMFLMLNLFKEALGGPFGTEAGGLLQRPATCNYKTAKTTATKFTHDNVQTHSNSSQ